MKKQQPLRVGILGAAQIAPSAMIEPAKALSEVSVVALAARDSARASAFAQKHAVPRTCPGYAELIADPDIDLVYNALPVSEHAFWSEAALRAGKHVLCEKPLAMNVDEVRRMRETCSSGARLIEAFHSRYHPAYETLRAWLDDPAAGNVVSLKACFNVGIADDGANIRHRPGLGGGAMMDLGCYPLMWALFVMGAEPSNVAATAVMTPSGVDERMRATLSFDGGVEAMISCSMAANEAFANHLSIVTEHSCIEFDNPLQPQNGKLTRHIHGSEQVATIDGLSTYHHQLAWVVRALWEGQALPTEGGALITQQRSLDRVYEAAGLGQLRQIRYG